MKNIIKALAGILVLCVILSQVSFAAAEDTVIRYQAHFQLMIGAAGSDAAAADCYEGEVETFAARNEYRSFAAASILS